MWVENNSFVVLIKSFANLFFKHLPQENRQVRVILRQPELMPDVCTLIVVSRLARVGLDILSLQTNHIQTTDVDFFISQASLSESCDESRIIALNGQSCRFNE